MKIMHKPNWVIFHEKTDTLVECKKKKNTINANKFLISENSDR